MAKQSVGNLSAKLSVQADDWNSGLRAAAETAESFAIKTSSAINQAGSSTRRNSQIFMEASRGLEDFLISFQTGGLAGGLRGAANNIGQIGSMISPMAGAWAAIGATITAITLPSLMKVIGAAKGINEQLKFAEDTAKRLMESAKEAQGFKEKISGIAGEKDAGQATVEANRLDADVKARQEILATTRRHIEAAGQNIASIQSQLKVSGEQLVDAANKSWNPGNILLGMSTRGVIASQSTQLSEFWKKRLSSAGESFLASLQSINPLERSRVSRGLSAIQEQKNLEKELADQAAKQEGELQALKQLRNAAAARAGELQFRELQRNAAGAVQATQVFGRKMYDMLVGSNPLEKMIEEDKKREMQRRETFAETASTRLEIKNLENEKNRLSRESGPKGDREMQRLQIQKLDAILSVLREQLKQSESNQLIGVSGE